MRGIKIKRYLGGGKKMPDIIMELGAYLGFIAFVFLVIHIVFHHTHRG